MTFANYTTVDLNTTGTTTLYDGDRDALVYGVSMANGGSTAVVDLEVTDGSDIAVLTPGQAGGDGIDRPETIALSKNDDLQANVTTIEGSDLTETAVALRGDPNPDA